MGRFIYKQRELLSMYDKLDNEDEIARLKNSINCPPSEEYDTLYKSRYLGPQDLPDVVFGAFSEDEHMEGQQPMYLLWWGGDARFNSHNPAEHGELPFLRGGVST